MAKRRRGADVRLWAGSEQRWLEQLEAEKFDVQTTKTRGIPPIRAEAVAGRRDRHAPIGERGR